MILTFRYYTWVIINASQWAIEKAAETQFGKGESSKAFLNLYDDDDWYAGGVTILRLSAHVPMRVDDFVDLQDLVKWWVRTSLFSSKTFGASPHGGFNDSRPFRFASVIPENQKGARGDVKYGTVGGKVMDKT